MVVHTNQAGAGGGVQVEQGAFYANCSRFVANQAITGSAVLNVRTASTRIWETLFRINLLLPWPADLPLPREEGVVYNLMDGGPTQTSDVWITQSQFQDNMGADLDETGPGVSATRFVRYDDRPYDWVACDYTRPPLLEEVCPSQPLSALQVQPFNVVEPPPAGGVCQQEVPAAPPRPMTPTAFTPPLIPYCIVELQQPVNAYLTPVPARTEKIQYPDAKLFGLNNKVFELTYDEPVHAGVYPRGTQLVIAGRYNRDSLPSPTRVSEDSYVVKVTHLIEGANYYQYDTAATYDRPTVPFRELWVNLKDLSANLSRWDNYNIIGDSNCLTTLTDSSPNNPALASDPDKNSELMSRYNYLELLRRYGVEIEHIGRDISLAEIEALYLAVSKVGSALDGLVSPIGAPVAFGHVYLTRAAFTGAPQPYMENYPSRFLLVRFTNQINDPDKDPNNTCKFRIRGDEYRTPARVDCHGTRGAIDPASIQGYSQYLFVHELGHFFHNLTLILGEANSFRVLVQTSELYDCQSTAPNLILGTDPILQRFFRPEKGWGSVSSDLNISPVSDFQQNPEPEKQDDVTMSDETAADLFLNWVYRTNSDAAPSLNINDACLYPNTEIWQGFQNIDEVGAIDSQGLAGNRLFWWTNQTMESLID